MRFVVTAAGLALVGVTALPAAADAPKGAYWRVETIYTATHPHTVGSGYHLTERSVSTDWTAPDGTGWSGYRELGARPATAKDEAAWRADGSPSTWAYRTEGMKVRLSTRPGKGSLTRTKGRPGWPWGEENVTYQQAQALPANAEALRERLTADVDTWIDEAAEQAKTTAPKATKQDWLAYRDGYVAERAAALLYALPAPDKVRAAAYQVIKTTQGVTDLGPAKDDKGRAGQRLALPVHADGESVSKEQLLVDTETMTVLEISTELTADGKRVLGKPGTQTITAGWTDDKRVPR
ncbi:hypothetical protein ABZ297_14055 [Nonomuraea sp. NPDC005983]|uniref:hypothetical protein n=1 Tax=Nonomuraea sp. NPDC005983 TaxID=3155595 RepID=UPI0033B4D0CC